MTRFTWKPPCATERRWPRWTASCARPQRPTAWSWRDRGAPTPRAVADLARHNCIGFNFRRAAPVWLLRESGRIVDRAVNRSLLANNGNTLRRMAPAGVGQARIGDHHARADLAAGRPVGVLSDAVEGDEEEIHGVHLGGARLPRRVRVFLDFTVPRLQAARES